jgi:hypothetical protein
MIWTGCNTYKKNQRDTFNLFNKTTYKLVSINDTKVFYYDDKKKNECNLYFKFSRIKKVKSVIYSTRITITDFVDNGYIDKIIFGAYLQENEEKKISLRALSFNRGHNLYRSSIFSILEKCLHGDYNVSKVKNKLILINDEFTMTFIKMNDTSIKALKKT